MSLWEGVYAPTIPAHDGLGRKAPPTVKPKKLTNKERAELEGRGLEVGLDLLGTPSATLSVRAACRSAQLTERYFYESFADKDVFVFRGETGQDRIQDFTDGVDMLQFYNRTFDDLSFSQSQLGTTISISGTDDSVFLLNIQASQLTEADFSFVG